MTTKAYAAYQPAASLEPYNLTRRDITPDDVLIDILYCGVCHSDIHTVENDWGTARFPVVPGHEIVGRVRAVGNNVRRFQAGDLVGVGCMVDSCQQCEACAENIEQYCEQGATATYNGYDKHTGGHTFGGYAQHIVVNHKFVLSIPRNLDLKAVAPLLCAGITTWSPLRHWKVKKGDKVGVIGLGGLGHMALKFARALGAEVVMITSSESKRDDAMRLGASDVLLSNDKDAMKAHRNQFDFILNTIPTRHDVNPYLRLLKLDATMTLIGAIENLEEMNGAWLIFGRRRLAGSLIGGIKETQEMLDFCGEHNIVSDVEVIDIKDINHAYARVKKAEVKYRFVIDMATLS